MLYFNFQVFLVLFGRVFQTTAKSLQLLISFLNKKINTCVLAFNYIVSSLMQLISSINVYILVCDTLNPDFGWRDGSCFRCMVRLFERQVRVEQFRFCFYWVDRASLSIVGGFERVRLNDECCFCYSFSSLLGFIKQRSEYFFEFPFVYILLKRYMFF